MEQSVQMLKKEMKKCLEMETKQSREKESALVHSKIGLKTG